MARQTTKEVLAALLKIVPAEHQHLVEALDKSRRYAWAHYFRLEKQLAQIPKETK